VLFLALGRTLFLTALSAAAIALLLDDQLLLLWLLVGLVGGFGGTQGHRARLISTKRGPADRGSQGSRRLTLELRCWLSYYASLLLLRSLLFNRRRLCLDVLADWNMAGGGRLAEVAQAVWALVCRVLRAAVH